MSESKEVTQNLWRVTAADFVVRTAYQMGKTPLLPLFAASIGAGPLLLGFIVSVSTMTGFFFKPIFGFLSDRNGRRLWMLIGIAVFSLMPFLYWLVETPQHLVVLRLFHGLATAIFGPVTLAYVAALAVQKRATRQGWFGLARSGSYLIAPTAAAWLLQFFSPEMVFSIIGAVSLVAFLPVFFLTEHRRNGPVSRSNGNPVTTFLRAAKTASNSPVLWFAGTMEMAIYVATYAIKAFLPLYAHLQLGVDLLTVGLFFTVQESLNLLARPIGGKLADHFGLRNTLAVALLVLSLAMSMLPFASTAMQFLLIAGAMGAALGVSLPTIIALYSQHLPNHNLGLGMGLLGTIRNLGKILGPVIGGMLLAFATYTTLFSVCAALILLLAITITFRTSRQENTDFI